MNHQDMQMLGQAILSMEDAVRMLEQSFNKTDIEGFNAAKKELLNLQRQVSKLLAVQTDL